MQAQKHTSYCFTIRSEMVFRHSCPGTYPSDKELIQIPQVDVEKLKRHPSNASLSSHDSGVAFSKADYEIQRAIKAQRVQAVQRPHIIVLHKGRPVARTNNNNNNNNKNNDNLYNHDEFEANIVVAAATASKRNRREIAVVQKRQTMISIGDNYPLNRQSFIKNNSTPNLHHSNVITKIARKENDENKENVEIKSQILLNKSLSVSKPKSKLFKSVSLSIRRLVGTNKEKKRKSRLIQQIHEQPKFF